LSPGKLIHNTVAVWPRFQFVRVAILLRQRKHVPVVGVSLCPSVRGQVNMGYPPMQHRHIYVLPGIQNISASFDLIDTIGTAQARFSKKARVFSKKETFVWLA
jgi:hypothetical protein